MAWLSTIYMREGAHQDRKECETPDCESLPRIFNLMTAFIMERKELHLLDLWHIKSDICCESWQVFDLVKCNNISFQHEATYVSISLQLHKLLVSCLAVLLNC